MSLQITTDDGVLNLGDAPSVQIKFINPFLVTDEGSNTVPQTLPLTPENKRNLGHPGNFDRKYRWRTSRACTFRAGAYVQKGLLKTFKAPPSDGITASVYFDTGYLYAQISSDLQLPDIDWEVRDPYTGSAAQKVTQWMTHLTQVMYQQVADDYHVFPIIYSFTADTNKYTDNITVFKMLNAIKRVDDNPMVLCANDAITETDSDGNTMTYPVGYGVTPFLKLSYVIRKMIEYFGYTLETNIFDTDADLSRLVVLNNTADAILPGKINFAQLIPDVSVKDFMEALCKHFGFEFIGNSNTKKVRVVMWNDVFGATPDFDLTSLITADPDPEYSDPTYLKFTEQKSLDRTATEKPTWEEMLKKYTSVTKITGSQQLEATSGTGLLLHLATGQYYLGTTLGTRTGKQRLGSDFYDIIPVASGKWETTGVEEITSSIEAVPMLGVNPTEHRYLNIICPFIGEIRHKNTAISTNGTISEEDEVDLKTMLCFSVPGLQFYGIGTPKSGRGTDTIDLNNPADPNITYTEQYRYYMGSTSCYNFWGKKWGNTSLKFQGENGLATKFYQGRSDMLRYSNVTITLELNLTFVQLQQLVSSIHLPKWFRNQPMLIESLTVDIDENRITNAEMVLRTYRKYEDLPN